jgi:hypothetical protein
MHISKLSKLLWLILAVSLSLLISGCVTIQDANTCAASGHITDGLLCSHLLTAQTEILSFNETLDFLDAQPYSRTCVPVPGFQVCADDQSHGALVTLPPRGAAVAMSSNDWGIMKTELETACRELGSRCSFKVQTAIKKMARIR